MIAEELVDLCSLEDRLLEQARDVYVQYLAEPTDSPWQQLLLPKLGVSVGCLLEGVVIGVAYGRPSPRVPGTISLLGIAIQGRHAKVGRGSRLLRFFEARASAHGYVNVSLGSAGGYVDDFYEKNGYECVGYLVGSSDDDEALNIVRQRYSQFVEAAETDFHFCVSTRSMPEETRHQFLRELKGVRVNAIMDKVIGESRDP